jgi:hypothetical protein
MFSGDHTVDVGLVCQPAKRRAIWMWIATWNQDGWRNSDVGTDIVMESITHTDGVLSANTSFPHWLCRSSRVPPKQPPSDAVLS